MGWLIVLLSAYVGAASLSDNSFFTHLTTGQRILEGHLPSTDPYTFTAHGHAWVIQSWFASLLYGLTYRVGHGLGLRLMVAVLSGLLGALLWRLSRPARSLVGRIVAVAPAIVVGFVAWGPRPLLFGLVGFALVLIILREDRDPRWLVPIMWVWVNTHGSFPLAGALIVVYGFGVWCDGGSTKRVARALLWCVVGIAVGGINPLGPKLLWFPIALLSKQDVLRHMVEWQAPAFIDTWQRAFLGALLVSIALVPRLRSGERYRVLLPALAFAALGFIAERNIVMASFLLVPLLAVEIDRLGNLVSRERTHAYTAFCAALAALTVVLVAVRLSSPSFNFSTYPVKSVGRLHAQGRFEPPHRVATQDVVGNYLEFRYQGQVPVFVDDRVDMFPKQVVNDEVTLFRAGSAWQDVLDRWKIDTVLWERSQPLATVLAQSDAWRLVRTDRTGSTNWVTYERVTSGGT